MHFMLVYSPASPHIEGQNPDQQSMAGMEERRYDVISILQTVKAGSNVAMHASFTNVPFSGHSLPGPHLC